MPAATKMIVGQWYTDDQARIGSILRSERNRHRGARIVLFHELQQNPVSVTCRDENGATYTVVAMRLREGIVKMTCQCQRYSQEGWCRHCLAVFSDCDVFESKKHREAFEQLVGRTHLEHAAAKLTKALDDFAGAYRKMNLMSIAANLKNLQNKHTALVRAPTNSPWRWKSLSRKPKVAVAMKSASWISRP